jgi:hypothetical protein
VEQLEPLVTLYEAFFTEVEPTADGSPRRMRKYRVTITRSSRLWERAEVEVEAEDTEAARELVCNMDDDDLDYREGDKDVMGYECDVSEIEDDSEHPDESAPQWKGTLR